MRTAREKPTLRQREPHPIADTAGLLAHLDRSAHRCGLRQSTHAAPHFRHSPYFSALMDHPHGLLAVIVVSRVRMATPRRF
jgi:hypothetical protein